MAYYTWYYQDTSTGTWNDWYTSTVVSYCRQSDVDTKRQKAYEKQRQREDDMIKNPLFYWRETCKK